MAVSTLQTVDAAIVTDSDSVYDIKRRMAAPPPISKERYVEDVATALVKSKISSSATKVVQVSAESPTQTPELEPEEPEDDGNAENYIERCLFCTEGFENLDLSFKHMASKHGLYIPDLEHLSSLESMLRYLGTVITQHFECLYCGISKYSAKGIRRHMLDKGHCMINLEREPELLEFWDFSDSERDGDKEQVKWDDLKVIVIDSSHSQRLLPSGKVAMTKAKAREGRRLPRKLASSGGEPNQLVITQDSKQIEDMPESMDELETIMEPLIASNNRTMSKRDATGLIGISNQQLQSLVTLERKTQRQAALVRASASWAGDLGGIHQRHYKQKMQIRYG